MAPILISELIEILDMIGTVYRSRDNSKPAEAIEKIKAQFSNTEDCAVIEWVAEKQAARNSPRKPVKKKVAQNDEIIAHFTGRLQACESETEIQFALDELRAAKPSATQWIEIARDITGQRERSGSAAQHALQAFLQARMFRQNSRDNIAKVFG